MCVCVYVHSCMHVCTYACISHSNNLTPPNISIAVKLYSDNFSCRYLADGPPSSSMNQVASETFGYNGYLLREAQELLQLNSFRLNSYANDCYRKNLLQYQYALLCSCMPVLVLAPVHTYIHVCMYVLVSRRPVSYCWLGWAGLYCCFTVPYISTVRPRMANRSCML